MRNRYETTKPSELKLGFFGAASGLTTGSLCRTNFGFCVDYGLFQGKYEERSVKGVLRNKTPTRKILEDIHTVLLTHPHIDHSGRLARAYAEGFSPIIVTTNTCAVFTETLLYNSADIQSKKRGDKLYSRIDVDNVMRHLHAVDPYVAVSIGQPENKLTAEFLPNGHVMGSSCVFVRNRVKHSELQNFLFTGDMGKPTQSLCGGYLDYAANYPNDPIHVLVVESTSFNSEPINFKKKESDFLNSIHETWDKGGIPLLPVLSFHRFQEILEILHNNQGGQIPEDCEIFIDAPLGMELLEDFKHLPLGQLTACYGDNPEFYKTEEESQSRFSLRHITIIKTHEESLDNDRKLARCGKKAIIIAGGGMGGHGRTVNYQDGEFGKNPNNGILFTCYQVAGTRGEYLVRNQFVPVGENRGASTKKVEGFTSHISGPMEAFDFLNRFNLGQLKEVYITHGNDKARMAMATEFKRRRCKANIILPQLDQKVEV